MLSAYNINLSILEYQYYHSTGNTDTTYYEKIGNISTENYVKGPSEGRGDSSSAGSTISHSMSEKLKIPTDRMPKEPSEQEKYYNLVQSTKTNINQFKTQDVKFADIVKRINAGEEEFYPNEAKSLFDGDYKEVLPYLIKHNNETLKELSSYIPGESSNIISNTSPTTTDLNQKSIEQLIKYHKTMNDQLSEVIKTKYGNNIQEAINSLSKPDKEIPKSTISQLLKILEEKK